MWEKIVKNLQQRLARVCFKRVGKLSEIILFPLLWIQWKHCRDHSSNNHFNILIHPFWIIFPWYFWDLQYYCFIVLLHWNSWEKFFLLLILLHQAYIIEINILCMCIVLKLVEVLWLFCIWFYMLQLYCDAERFNYYEFSFWPGISFFPFLSCLLSKYSLLQKKMNFLNKAMLGYPLLSY